MEINSIPCRINEEDILSLELYVSEGSADSLLELKNNLLIRNNDNTSVYDMCFGMINLALQKKEENLKLDAIKVVTTDLNKHYIFKRDFTDLVTNNALAFMISILKYIKEKQCISALKLNYSTFDYDNYGFVTLDLNEQQKTKTRRK